jgi:uncharacterized membrane protein YedE/YeeE
MVQGLKRYVETAVCGFWSPVFSLVALGVLAAFYFGTLGAAWAVTGEFTRWGGHFLHWVGFDTNASGYLQLIHFTDSPLTRVDGVMVIGMFAGAFISALLGQNVKLRFPSKRRILQALAGGILAGFGTRLAMGCNLAALFTGIPQFSFHTWLFTLGTIVGTYFGVKISLLSCMQGKPKLVAADRAMATEIKPSAYYRYQPYLGGILLAACMFFVFAEFKASYPFKLLLAICFGFGFGFLIQKGQVCFTSAFRDLWLTGRSTMAKALIWGIAVQTLITAYYLMQGMAPNVIWWAGPAAVIGGILFGIGIVVAGGCETGWMYRAVEGQVQFWFVGLGNIIGATILVLAWDGGVYQSFIEPFPRVNLAHELGFPGAILATAVLLAVLYFWADWRQKHKKGFLYGRDVR